MSPNPPTALVTGASAGIGAEIAHALARRGYRLVLVARREEALSRIAAAIEGAHGVRVHLVPCDLARADAPSIVLERLDAARLRVDVLVNNAGFGLRGPFVSTDLATEERMIAVNVTSVVALTKALLPAMVERGEGMVINVASVASFLPGPLMSIYYASKAFVLSFSEALAEELRGSGVRVSALCPGPVGTEFQSVAGMPRSRVREAAMMSAADVAEAGVRGALAGRRVVVPGLRNKAVTWALRGIPRRVVAWLSRRAAEVA